MVLKWLEANLSKNDVSAMTEKAKKASVCIQTILAKIKSILCNIESGKEDRKVLESHLSKGEVSSKYIIGKIDFPLALQTIFGENQVNIMQNKYRKRETEGISVGKKGQKRLLYVLQTIFRGQMFKLMKNTVQKRGTKSIRGWLEWKWGQNNGHKMQKKDYMGIIDHLQDKPGQYYVWNIKTEVLKTSEPNFSENKWEHWKERAQKTLHRHYRHFQQIRGQNYANHWSKKGSNGIRIRAKTQNEISTMDVNSKIELPLP